MNNIYIKSQFIAFTIGIPTVILIDIFLNTHSYVKQVLDSFPESVPIVLIILVIWYYTLLSLHDIEITEDGFKDISLFRKEFYQFSEIYVDSIKISTGPSFIMKTDKKDFIWAYTKKNFMALKTVIEKSPGPLFVFNLEKMVNTYFIDLK